ncbi:MAG TPA: hypothetical protein VNM67_02695 [Thermoanaerobaculia bacterium]|jgi:hypothetical protein|nr:hypothetical protein [Thermoanaerobaculia bacterium]
MSTEVAPRNRYVLRKESGHPGYSNVVVLGTAQDLRRLSEDVQELAAAGRGRVEHYVTEEKRPTSLGSVVFEVISAAELIDLQRAEAKHWLSERFGCPAMFVVKVAILALAVYGGICLLS